MYKAYKKLNASGQYCILGSILSERARDWKDLFANFETSLVMQLVCRILISKTQRLG